LVFLVVKELFDEDDEDEDESEDDEDERERDRERRCRLEERFLGTAGEGETCSSTGAVRRVTRSSAPARKMMDIYTHTHIFPN
jgi:hypothetical protein